jgi:hypothetical protein
MKMKTVFGRVVTLLGVAASISLTPTLCQATLLNPGTGVIPVPAEPDPSGGILQTQWVANYSSLSGQIQGTITSEVISGDANNPWVGLGGLTFTYRIDADVASTEAVGDFTVGNTFGGYQTDASYLSIAGVIPNLMDRSGSGNIINFNFAPSGISGGQNSVLLVIQTDASAYTSGVASVIDGETDTVPSFAPALIPEPGTAALLLLGTGVLMWRRQRT